MTILHIYMYVYIHIYIHIYIYIYRQFSNVSALLILNLVAAPQPEHLTFRVSARIAASDDSERSAL